MSTKSFFDRDVVERAAQSMLDRRDSSGSSLAREITQVLGLMEKTDSEIRDAFKQAARKLRGA